MKAPANLITALVAVSFVATGCVTDDQLGPVRNFSSAATEFSSQANNTLTELNTSYVDRNIAKVASGDGSLSDETFKGVLDTDAGFKASQDSLTALGTYAAALNSLATASYTASVDSAATDLYGSLQSLDKDAKAFVPETPAISKEDWGFVADAVKALGEAIADEKRLNAIKKAVHTANPGVQIICKGFQASLEGIGSTYHKNLDVIYSSAFKAYKESEAGLSYDARVSKMNELRAEKLAVDNSTKLIDKLAESAAALAKTHAALDSALQDDKLDWAAVVREVGQLKSLAQDVKTFNSSLQKTSP